MCTCLLYTRALRTDMVYRNKRDLPKLQLGIALKAESAAKSVAARTCWDYYKMIF